MAEEIVIGKLIIDNSDLDRAMLESKKAVVELENAQKALKKETDNLADANEDQLQTFIKNETALKKARAEYSANQKTVLELTRAQTGLDNALAENVKTQDQAIANTKALTEARRKIDTTTVEGAKAIAEINAKIDSNNKLIKDSSSALEQQKANVGNYPQLMGAVSSSFGQATTQVIGFAQQGKEIIGELTQTITNLRTAQEASKTATEALTAAKTIETQATQAATVAETDRVAVGFRYTQGKATETEVEAANTAATVANAQATRAQAATTAAATTATEAGTVATKALRLAMLSIPLIALLALLAPFVAFLTSTQEGMDKITSVTRPLVAIFQSFIGVLQDAGKRLFEAFSNPKQLLIDLADFVKNNLINRFKAFGVILDGIVNLDFKKLANGLGQAATGVENLSGKIQGAADKTAKFLADAAAKGAELDRLEKSLEKTRVKNVLALGKATEEVKAQNRIVEDQTKTAKERERAALKSIEAGKEINRLKNQELDLEIAILKNKQSRNDTSRAEQKELNELIAKKNENNAQELELETTQNTKLNEIRKSAAAARATEAKAANDRALKEAQNRIDILKLEASQSDLTADQKLKNAQKVFELEVALAKRSTTGTDQQKAILQSRQTLSSAILAIADEQISAEIEAQKKAVAENNKITQAERDSQLQSANDLAAAQTLLLNKKLLSEKDYAAEVLKINQAKNESIDTIEKNFIEFKKVRDAEVLANQKALDEVAFQIKLQDIQDKDATEQEIKTALLQANFDNELALLVKSLENKEIAENVYLAKKTLAEKKFASATIANEKILAKQKISLAENAASKGIAAAQAVFGESKALAVASALLNTYQGITAELSTKTVTPYEIGLKVANVAFVAASGFAAVRNILKTQKGSTDTGADSQRTPTTTGAGAFVNGAQTSTIATVSERPTEQNIAVTPPVLILESLAEAQNLQAVKINSQ